MGAELVRYERGELEALTLADRIALEGAIEHALPLLRELNDEEIRRLKRAGASQRAIAEAMGVSRTTAQRRLARLGLAADPARPVPRNHPVPQNGGDPVTTDAEAVHDKPVTDDRPAPKERWIGGPPGELLDEVIEWVGQGRAVGRLLEQQDRLREEDRATLPADYKHDLDIMDAVSERLREALR